MWVIRRSQMVALESATAANALDRLVRHLRAACPAQTRDLNDEQLLDEVNRGVEHAKRYGFEREVDLRAFLECRVELGADFDEREDTAWARDVLNDETLFPEQKAEFLGDRHFAAGSGGEPQ
jgi:hypothetical protein